MRKKIGLSFLFFCFSLILFSVITVCAATYGDYTYTVSNGEITITDVKTTVKNEVSIPATIEGYPVTCIGVSSFENCTGITSVIIPDSVNRIERNAFKGCVKLINVTDRKKEKKYWF